MAGNALLVFITIFAVGVLSFGVLVWFFERRSSRRRIKERRR